MKAMRQDWQFLRVAPEATVLDTIKTIDTSRLGIALVVDASGRLLGTVTDGDVRRAVLRDVSLGTCVQEIMARRFVSLPPNATAAAARSVMQGAQIKLIPALDEEARVVGVFCLPDLVGTPPKPNWVVVMAGGEGRRLRPLTNDLPKPMLPIAGQPILELAVRRLVGEGFKQIFLSVNYRGDKIEDHFGDGSAFGCQITYIREDRPLGTGGALSLLPVAPTRAVLVINGDLVTDVNFSALLEYHEQHEGAASLCVREFTQSVPYGVIQCEGDRVAAMQEKPKQRFLINAGMYVIEPRLLALLPKDEPCALPDLIARGMSAGEKVHAFLIHEQWVDIGLPDDYERIRNGVG